MILYDDRRRPLDLNTEVGRGGEAAVYRIASQPDRLAKIYDPAPRSGYDAKLAWMIAHPPANPTRRENHSSLAWPDGLVFDAQGHLRGYAMPFVRSAAPVLDVFNPRRRSVVMPASFDRRHLHRVARNLAAALAALHRSGYVAGDLNESNVLVTVDALVTLIDTDSFQVTADQTNRSVIYPCPVGKLEYTAPELQGQRLAEVVRRPEQDAFGLAVLIFQLLMEGNHPFRAQWMARGEPPPLEKRIAQGAFPYTSAPTAPVLPPRNAPDLNLLNPWLAELLRRCFLDGHSNPALRPSPDVWRDAIVDAEKHLKSCSSGHFYSDHLRTCPACAALAAAGKAMPSAGGRSGAPLPRTGPGGTNVARPTPGVSAASGRYAAPPTGSGLSGRVAQAPAPRSSGLPVNWGLRPAAASGAPAHGAMPGRQTVAASSPAGHSAAGSSAAGSSAAAAWVRQQRNSSIQWRQRPFVGGPAGAIRRLGMRAWLRQQLMRSLQMGGSFGALAGMLPGLALGLVAGLGNQAPVWTLLFALGGVFAGAARGWQPGYRLAGLIERWIGWRRFWRGLGVVMGGLMGLGFGLAFAPVLFVIILGPLLGGSGGLALGEKIWRSGRSLGWERIWAVVGAASMAGFGWVVAGLVGASGVSELGPNLALALEYGGVRPLLTAILAGGFCSALGGLTAGILVDLAAGLLGLAD